MDHVKGIGANSITVSVMMAMILSVTNRAGWLRHLPRVPSQKEWIGKQTRIFIISIMM